jgi:hypothetical protein
MDQQPGLSKNPAAPVDSSHSRDTGSSQRPNGTQRAAYRDAFVVAYKTKRADAIRRGLSQGMADHVAHVHADREATAASGMNNAALTAEIVY